MIRRILLDIDDVCNQCTQYALQWVGCPMDYENFFSAYPPGFGYRVVDVANHLLGYKRFDVPSFWNMIPRVFWSTCPVSEEYGWLLDACINLVGPDNVCFLTGPTKDPDCLAGKLEWISRNSPDFMHRQYLIGPRKQFCAHPYALLIDDNDANIEKFQEWGGQGLLVPRPWNKLSGLTTASFLEDAFEDLRHGRMVAA